VRAVRLARPHPRALWPSLLALLICLWSPAQSQARPPAPPVKASGTVQIAFTPWDNAEAMIVEAIGAARRQILVQAYSFTSRNIANALVAARQRGVEVRVSADREQTFSGENSRIPDLANAGIPVLLEVRYLSAHNKTMVIDEGTPEPVVISGSYNWTFAAQNRNAENVMVFRRNDEMARAFAANWRRHAAEALPYLASQ
jgi:phosphatidylserine/phosphatidylglycerophosphate/cardiolipin synthase-like enzyme